MVARTQATCRTGTLLIPQGNSCGTGTKCLRSSMNVRQHRTQKRLLSVTTAYRATMAYSRWNSNSTGRCARQGPMVYTIKGCSQLKRQLASNTALWYCWCPCNNAELLLDHQTAEMPTSWHPRKRTAVKYSEVVISNVPPCV